MSIVYGRIDALVRSSSHILMITDERIDGDTVGSALGMMHSLVLMGKRVSVYVCGEVPDCLRFLPGVEVMRADEEVLRDERVDMVMIFDSARIEYLEGRIAVMRRTVPVVVFDHHLSPGFGDVDLIEESAASTADVVWRFLKAMKYPVNADVAQCLLTGICTDTNLFSTANTDLKCFDAAIDLTRHGARLKEIVKYTMMERSVMTLKLWGLALERLHRNEEFQAVATAITDYDLDRIGATADDASGLSEFLYAMVEDADTVLVLRELKSGIVKGSLRSSVQDVGEMARKIGGGGHKQAAGFKVPDARLVEKDGVWEIEKRVVELPVK